MPDDLHYLKLELSAPEIESAQAFVPIAINKGHIDIILKCKLFHNIWNRKGCYEMHSTEYRGISIQVEDLSANPFFIGSVEEDLNLIYRTATGRILFTKIAAGHPSVRTSAKSTTRSSTFPRGVNVVIVPKRSSYIQSGFKEINFVNSSNKIDSTLVPSLSPGHNPTESRFYARLGALTVAADNDAAEDGSGSVATVYYSNAAMVGMGSTIIPSFIVLAHELIHAAHYIYGHRIQPTISEENRTVGLGAWSDLPDRPLVCENNIRQEASLPLRTSYGD